MAETSWAEERGDIAVRGPHSHKVELARDTAVVIQCISDFLEYVSLIIQIQCRASVHQPLVDDDDDAPVCHVGAHPPAWRRTAQDDMGAGERPQATLAPFLL